MNIKLDSVESLCYQLNKIIDENNLSKTPINIYHLNHYSTGNLKNFRSFNIKKRNGKLRQITAPLYNLKLIQKALQLYFESLFKTQNTAATGFIKGKSIVDNAQPHTNKAYLLNVDIENYFQSITESHIHIPIKKLFKANNVQVSEEIIQMIIRLVCIYDTYSKRYVLPQGSPSSPILSNIVFEKIDKEIEAICLNKSITYTRYADDLTFSSDLDVLTPSDSFYNELKQLLFLYGFNINKTKTRFQTKNRRQMVTGLVVNKHPNIPKEKYKELRYWLYLLRRYSYYQVQLIFEYHYPDRNNLILYLNGYLRYVNQFLNVEHSKFFKLKEAFNKLFSSNKFKIQYNNYRNQYGPDFLSPNHLNNKSYNISSISKKERQLYILTEQELKRLGYVKKSVKYDVSQDYFEVLDRMYQLTPGTAKEISRQMRDHMLYKRIVYHADISWGNSVPVMMSVDPYRNRESEPGKDDFIHTNKNLYYYTRRLLYTKAADFSMRVFVKEVDGKKQLVVGVALSSGRIIDMIDSFSEDEYKEFAKKLIELKLFTDAELPLNNIYAGRKKLNDEFTRIFNTNYNTLNERDKALYSINHVAGIATPIIMLNGEMHQMDTSRFLDDEKYRSYFDPELLNRDDELNPAIALFNYGLSKNYYSKYSAAELPKVKQQLIDYYKLLFKIWHDAYANYASNPNTLDDSVIGIIKGSKDFYADVEYDYESDPIPASEFANNIEKNKTTNEFNVDHQGTKKSYRLSHISPVTGEHRRTNIIQLQVRSSTSTGYVDVKIEMPQITQQYIDDIITQLKNIRKRDKKIKGRDLNLSMAILFLRENNATLAYMRLNKAKNKSYQQIDKLLSEFESRGIIRNGGVGSSGLRDTTYVFDKGVKKTLDKHIDEIIEFYEKLNKIKGVFEKPKDVSQRYFLREAFYSNYNENRAVTYARFIHEPYWMGRVNLRSEKKASTITYEAPDYGDSSPIIGFDKKGSVTVVNRANQISFEKARQELAKILGEEFVTSRLTFEFMMSRQGQNLLGWYDNESKRIELSYYYNIKGEQYVSDKTVRHEALHFIVNNLLRDDLKKKLFDQVRKEAGEDVDVDEYLSEKYELFRDRFGDVGGTGIKGSIAFFFGKWKNALLNFFGKRDYISELYFRADSGYYRIYTNTPSTYSSNLPTWL